MNLPTASMASFLHYPPLKTRAAGEKKPLTAPVSVSVSAVVWAQPPVVPPNFRELKESRLSGTLRFDSHREWRSLSPQLVSFQLQKRVSLNKDMSINTQDSAEVVCTELFGAVFHSNIPKHHTDTAGAPALSTTLMSLHIMSAITHTVRVLSPLSLAHLMCAFSVLLTCDTTDLNPVTEPSNSPTRSEALSLYWQYILRTDDIWILEQLCWVTAVAWTGAESTWSHRLRWICFYMRACTILMPQSSLTKITHQKKKNLHLEQIKPNV